jgi:hypothetical protein
VLPAVCGIGVAAVAGWMLAGGVPPSAEVLIARRSRQLPKVRAVCPFTSIVRRWVRRSRSMAGGTARRQRIYGFRPASTC